MKTKPFCTIASLHASKDLEQGGGCDCIHCQRECDCLDMPHPTESKARTEPPCHWNNSESAAWQQGYDLGLEHSHASLKARCDKLEAACQAVLRYWAPLDTDTKAEAIQNMLQSALALCDQKEKGKL